MKRVLIVDDSPFFVTALGEMLTDEGFDVTTAGSGEHALQLLQEAEEPADGSCRAFDLIITDLVMPGMSGLDLSSHVRSHNRVGRFVPVIMLTENEMTREEARNHGCAAYIPKSNLKKMVAMTRTLLAG